MMTKMIANQPTRGDQLFLTKDFTQREPMILETLQAVPIYKGRLKLRFTLITRPSSKVKILQTFLLIRITNDSREDEMEENLAGLSGSDSKSPASSSSTPSPSSS